MSSVSRKLKPVEAVFFARRPKDAHADQEALPDVGGIRKPTAFAETKRELV